VFPRKRRHRMGRKKHSKELKARIALDAIKGQKTMSELASEYGVHEVI
jgi:transposase-like protein